MALWMGNVCSSSVHFRCKRRLFVLRCEVLHKVSSSNTNMASKPTESDEERIVKAENYKAEGNEFFKKQDFKPAIKRYHIALLYLRGIGEKHPITGERNILTDEWKKRHDEMRFGCYNNLAGCVFDIPRAAFYLYLT